MVTSSALTVFLSCSIISERRYSLLASPWSAMCYVLVESHSLQTLSLSQQLVQFMSSCLFWGRKQLIPTSILFILIFKKINPCFLKFLFSLFFVFKPVVGLSFFALIFLLTKSCYQWTFLKPPPPNYFLSCLLLVLGLFINCYSTWRLIILHLDKTATCIWRMWITQHMCNWFLGF